MNPTSPIDVISNDSFDRFLIGFTRVRELLDDPKDTAATACAFLDELSSDYNLRHPVIVIHREPILDYQLGREEIEYQFTVIANVYDMRYLEIYGAPYSITLFSERLTKETTSWWRTDIFTEEERKTLLLEKSSEIQDCAKNLAEDDLDEIFADSHPDERCELIMYVDPDTQISCDLLHAIRTSRYDAPETEEEEAYYAPCLAFLKRFKLVDDLTGITDLGRFYLEAYGD
jgi:hypothetical protein